MSRFHSKFLIAFISLCIIVLFGLGILLGQVFKVYYVQALNERLMKESNLLAIYLEKSNGIYHINEAEIEQFSKALDVRTTITNSKGSILYSSGNMSNTSMKGLKSIIDDVARQNSKTQDKLEEGDGYDLHYYWKPVIQNGNKEGYLFLSTKSDELKKAYIQIWWILSISLGIAFIVIAFLGSRITARFTKPIESAVNVAIELSKGNYRARAKVSRHDETEMLGSSINMLAQNLQEMVKAQEMQRDRLTTLIENIGAGLLLIDSRGFINLVNKGYIDIFHVHPTDYLSKLYYEVIENEEVRSIISEVFRTEQKVSRQMMVPLMIERRYFAVYGVPVIGASNVWKGVLLVFHDITELKKLEKMRKDFVANVSHELKTPITSIKGFTETLLDGAMNDKDTLEAFLSIILKESDRLQTLILDLLELSKIEQEGFTLSIAEMDLRLLLDDVITMLNGKAEEKGIQLYFVCNHDKVMITGDVNRLKQVFINLIMNAITYTPKNGEVTVILTEQGDHARVHVKDTGIGINKEEIPRIFERFYRVDRARSRNSGGTGLGLAIVKHLVEAHHGNISVLSEVGKGSEFIIELHKYLN